MHQLTPAQADMLAVLKLQQECAAADWKITWGDGSYFVEVGGKFATGERLSTVILEAIWKWENK